MGVCKVDIYKKDRYYQNTSYSSVEDLKNIFYMLPEIYADYEAGNKEALIIINDIADFIKDKKVTKEYYNIQIGHSPITQDESNKGIFEIISDRLQINTHNVRSLYSLELNTIVSENLDKWLSCAKKRSKPTNTHNHIGDNTSRISDKSYWDLDFSKKYVFSKHVYHKEYPKDLQDLIDLYTSNKEEIKIIQTTKNKDVATKKELNKRISFSKQLNEDIKLLKSHYSIPYNTSAVQDDVVFDLKENDFAEELINDDWMIDKINDIALEILNDRQYIIYQLYFCCHLNNNEIAKLIGTSKQNVSSLIKVVTQKIKNCISSR